MVSAVVENDESTDDIIRTTYYIRMRAGCDGLVNLLWNTHLPSSSAAKFLLYMSDATSSVNLAWGEVRLRIDHQRLTFGRDIGRQAAQKVYLVACIEQLDHGGRSERTSSRAHRTAPQAPKHRLDQAAPIRHPFLYPGSYLLIQWSGKDR